MNINVGDSIKMNGNVGEIVKFTTDAQDDEFVCVLSVSYTHLTLPTILHV